MFKKFAVMREKMSKNELVRKISHICENYCKKCGKSKPKIKSEKRQKHFLLMYNFQNNQKFSATSDSNTWRSVCRNNSFSHISYLKMLVYRLWTNLRHDTYFYYIDLQYLNYSNLICVQPKSFLVKEASVEHSV